MVALSATMCSTSSTSAAPGACEPASCSARSRDHPLRIDAIEDVFVHEATDPEVVIGQWRMRGSVLATGAAVEVTGLLVLRVRAGQIVHCHDFMDAFGIARALGWPPFAAPAS